MRKVTRIPVTFEDEKHPEEAKSMFEFSYKNTHLITDDLELFSKIVNHFNSDDTKELKPAKPHKKVDTKKVIKRKQPNKRYTKPRQIIAWTEAEDERLFSLLHLHPNEIAKDKTLRKRHTKQAIATRAYVLIKGRFKDISQDTVKRYKEYLEQNA